MPHAVSAPRRVPRRGWDPNRGRIRKPFLSSLSTASGGLVRRHLSSPSAAAGRRAVIEYRPARLARRGRYRKKGANFRIALGTTPCRAAQNGRRTFRKESRQSASRSRRKEERPRELGRRGGQRRRSL